MSFYPQPSSYECGPFALKYALVMLGQFRSEKELGRIAGSNWWNGTDEIGLAKAAKASDCEMKYFRKKDPKIALRSLTAHLKQAHPCILSVDNWEHWFTVINYQSGRYVVVDSKLPKVIKIYSPAAMLKRWKYTDEETSQVSYDGYAIIPKFRTATKGKFSLEVARKVMHEKNKEVAEKWDIYFNDLIDICRPLTGNSKFSYSFTEFLRRYEKLLIRRVAHWHGDPKHSELRKILDNMEFVADVYDLRIYEKDEEKVLVDVTSLLMMYACGRYGMDPIY